MSRYYNDECERRAEAAAEALRSYARMKDIDPSKLEAIVDDTMLAFAESVEDATRPSEPALGMTTGEMLQGIRLGMSPDEVTEQIAKNWEGSHDDAD